MALDPVTGSVLEKRSIGGGGAMIYVIKFDGDAAYPAGGSTDFEQFVRNIDGAGSLLTVVGVSAGDCGGYVPFWDIETDKLVVRQSAGAAAPMTESTTPDMSAISFRLSVTVT